MLHELIKIWFGWLEHWGYWGVFVLMAMESSIIPVPSELVMPPAAFWAAQGKMNFWLVILAGTAGSYVGSLICYLGAKWLGLPLVRRYGKYFFITNEKLIAAEQWVIRYGMVGIFIARLLPVIRHLISMPAGILKMPLKEFTIATVVGAGLWCTVLAWFGKKTLGEHPELLSSPEAMVHAIKAQSEWWVLGAIAFIGLYFLMLFLKRKSQTA